MRKLSVVVFAMGLTSLLLIGPVQLAAAQDLSKKNFTIDVACDGGKLALHPADPADPPFSRGDVGVATGRIFPSGTLTSPVPNPTGDLGTWRCVLASLAEPPLDAAITYYFSLVENGEESMLLVQGLTSHLSPDRVPRVHAVVGGTGKYEGASGEVREEVIRGNASGCFDFRFQFSLKKKPGK
jgi:hypothetical protein